MFALTREEIQSRLNQLEEERQKFLFQTNMQLGSILGAIEVLKELLKAGEHDADTEKETSVREG